MGEREIEDFEESLRKALLAGASYDKLCVSFAKVLNEGKHTHGGRNGQRHNSIKQTTVPTV